MGLQIMWTTVSSLSMRLLTCWSSTFVSSLRFCWQTNSQKSSYLCKKVHYHKLLFYPRWLKLPLIFKGIPETGRLQALQSIMLLMPDENRETLQYLLLFLSEVAEQSDINQVRPSSYHNNNAILILLKYLTHIHIVCIFYLRNDLRYL